MQYTPQAERDPWVGIPNLISSSTHNCRVRGPRNQYRKPGDEVRWSADGTRAYYRSSNRIMSVDVALDPEIRISEPKVFYSGFFENVGGRSYAIHPDGERALVIKSQNLASLVRVISNWFAKVEKIIKESETHTR